MRRSPSTPDGGNRCARIFDLEAPPQGRQRQIDQRAFVLEYQSAVLLEGLPVLAGDVQRRSNPSGHLFKLCPRRVGLRRHDARNIGLEDTGLFPGDLGERGAEILLVVIVDGRDHRQARGVHHIGGIEPAAEAGLENEVIGRDGG